MSSRNWLLCASVDTQLNVAGIVFMSAIMLYLIWCHTIKGCPYVGEVLLLEVVNLTAILCISCP